nr:MAG TPA: hypothetical protein [Caudoviricetes sp.]
MVSLRRPENGRYLGDRLPEREAHADRRARRNGLQHPRSLVQSVFRPRRSRAGSPRHGQSQRGRVSS